MTSFIINYTSQLTYCDIPTQSAVHKHFLDASWVILLLPFEQGLCDYLFFHLHKNNSSVQVELPIQCICIRKGILAKLQNFNKCLVARVFLEIFQDSVWYIVLYKITIYTIHILHCNYIIISQIFSKVTSYITQQRRSVSCVYVIIIRSPHSTTQRNISY